MVSRFWLFVTVFGFGLFGHSLNAAEPLQAPTAMARATVRLQQGLRINTHTIERLRGAHVEMQVSNRIFDQGSGDVSPLPTAGQSLTLIEMF